MTDRPDRTRADVKATYDRIGPHFSKTRKYPWPEVEAFVADATPAGVGLDIGCGNGRHTEPLADACERAVGVDVSRPLLAEATDRREGRWVDLLQGDATALPIAEGAVDVAVYVATLHHLPSRADRVGSLNELARVLAHDGRALVSAWSVAADRFDRTEAFDTTIEWTLPDGETVDRYYHIYDRAAFEADLKASALVGDVEVSSGNFYARCRVDPS